jgi:hypothetical protein
MSRQVCLLGVGMAIIAGAFALTDRLRSPEPGEPVRNLRRIREGMTLREVESLFGGPAHKQDRGDGCKRAPMITPDKPWVCATGIRTFRTAEGAEGRGGGPIDWTYKWHPTYGAVLRTREGRRGKTEVLFDAEDRVVEFKLWSRDGAQ